VTDWLVVAGSIFAINLLPAFGPPTWAVLVFFRLNSDLPAVPLVLLGAVAAASGRFVLEPFRNRGVGAALLDAVIAAADERRYARLVLSPSERAVPFYRRAGFIVPDEAAGSDRLLVRQARSRNGG